MSKIKLIVLDKEMELEKARELLLTTKKSVSEAATITGFKNLSSFSRAFKTEYGYSPSEISRSRRSFPLEN